LHLHAQIFKEISTAPISSASYFLTFYRKYRSHICGLSIRTSSGALNLSPAFSPTQLSYSVTTNTGWVIITPQYTNAGQGVRVEGGVNLASGTESSRRLLQVGANPIEIWSTAQSGGRKTYIINVTRTR
jgi:hypothetical protein